MSIYTTKGKLGYLFSNMGWMTISNFASKVLVFLMVPYYTRVLSTGDYGLYDLGYTAVILLAPAITANSGEALMRFSLVEKDRVSHYFSAAFALSLLCSVVAILLGVSFLFIPLDNMSVRLCVFGTCLYLSASIQYFLFSQFARGIERVKDMAIGGLVNSFALVLTSFFFLSIIRTGIIGCFIACSSGCIVGAFYISARCKFWNYFVIPCLADLKELAQYGIPLVANTFGWWINSSFSRYATAFFCGITSAGLLAAAYKIPSIPKAIQQIFIQAWQISSIRDFDKYDKDGFFGGVYDVTCCVSSILISFVILITPTFAQIIFSEEFFGAWQFVPLLSICLVFDCLASVIGGIFAAVGDTKPIAYSALVSVVAAIICCIVLIPVAGIQGAALASTISSVVIWAMRLLQSRKYISMKINWFNFFVCVFLLIVQTVLALFMHLDIIWQILQVFLFLAICLSAFFIALRRELLKIISMKGRSSG